MINRQRPQALISTTWEASDIAWLITDGYVSHVDHLTRRTGMSRVALEAALRRNGFHHLIASVHGLAHGRSHKSRTAAKVSQ